MAPRAPCDATTKELTASRASTSPLRHDETANPGPARPVSQGVRPRVRFRGGGRDSARGREGAGHAIWLAFQHDVETYVETYRHSPIDRPQRMPTTETAVSPRGASAGWPRSHGCTAHCSRARASAQSRSCRTTRSGGAPPGSPDRAVPSAHGRRGVRRSWVACRAAPLVDLFARRLAAERSRQIPCSMTAPLSRLDPSPDPIVAEPAAGTGERLGVERG